MGGLSLVYITKSTSAPQNLPTNGRNETRFLKYQMQAISRHILKDFRVRICLRHQIDRYGSVDVFKHRNTQRAFYGGLMVCGSVWVCPVCAAKITERRRNELSKAVQLHKNQGLELSMLTLTFSHSKLDKLEDLIMAFRKALNKMQSGRRYVKLKDELQYVGTVRAMEITYGENGWHPHVHLLIFHKTKIDPHDFEDFEDSYFALWQGACASVGLSTSREHGVKLDDAREAENYVTKHGEIEKEKTDKNWTVDMELTKANTKKGRVGSLTPFDFLRVVVEDGDLTYKRQYQEYAAATKGMRQLFWSRGLKKHFGIEDKTDEEVATEKEEEADLLCQLSWRDWKYILDHNLRADLLDKIEQYGYIAALEKIGLYREKDTMGDSVQGEAL